MILLLKRSFEKESRRDQKYFRKSGQKSEQSKDPPHQPTLPAVEHENPQSNASHSVAQKAGEAVQLIEHGNTSQEADDFDADESHGQ